MSYHRSGPSPLTIILVGAFFVFGGYYVWTGFIHFLEYQDDITGQTTRNSHATETAEAAPDYILPTLFMAPATFTPLPPCRWFTVSVENAVYRDCPAQNNIDCPVREVIPYGTELCIYGRVPNNMEWYVVELNPDGAYRDIVYIHESVVEAVNPTPTITPTNEPLNLPTVSPTPSHTPAPTAIPTETPIETSTETPPITVPPTTTPEPTLPNISI
ncbi:MAG: hypothetical protein JXA10_05480 [Anaerolineae bacterium]|nr:hypothetical protein [Anaerolineae bacterium]